MLSQGSVCREYPALCLVANLKAIATTSAATSQSKPQECHVVGQHRLLSSQDHSMNLNHPCHLYPIFPSYSGMEKVVKIWQVCEVIFAPPDNEKPTLKTNENRKPSSPVLFQSCSDSTSTTPSGRMRSFLESHHQWVCSENSSLEAAASHSKGLLCSLINNNSWIPGFSTDCLSAARCASSLHGPWKQSGLNGSMEQQDFLAGFDQMNLLTVMKEEQLRASILPN